jgi:predicted RNA methylase
MNNLIQIKDIINTNEIENIFSSYEKEKARLVFLSTELKKDDIPRHFFNNDYSYSRTVNCFDIKPAIASLDAEYWQKIMSMTDVLDCMPAQKRNEWSEKIHDHDTPPFEKKIVIDTMANLIMNRSTFFADKVDGIFRNLSREHVTNSPNGFRKRMIVGQVLELWGPGGSQWRSVNHKMAEYLADFRAIIAKLRGMDTRKYHHTSSDLSRIMEENGFGQWYEFDGGAFRMRIYKKGTAHLEVHPEIAVQLNRILATKHPQAIAGESMKAPKVKTKLSPQKHFLSEGVLDILYNFKDSFKKDNRQAFFSNYNHDERDFEEAKNVLRLLGGADDNGTWSFEYSIRDALSEVCRVGTVPEKVSHQFYPTPSDLAERAIDLADIAEDDRVLEPSAGNGALAQKIAGHTKNVTCVEVNGVFSAALKSQGFDTHNADFLSWKSPYSFTKIIMNPPFAKGEAERHVKKASEFLADGGQLVAILPASLKGKEIVPGRVHDYTDTIEDAFDDTGVCVVILNLQ